MINKQQHEVINIENSLNSQMLFGIIIPAILSVIHDNQVSCTHLSDCIEYCLAFAMSFGCVYAPMINVTTLTSNDMAHPSLGRRHQCSTI